MADALAPFATALRVLHALAGVALVVGIFGRWVVLGRAASAARSGELSVMSALLKVSAPFERVVILSSAIVLLLGLLTAWSMGYPLLGPFQDGPNWLFVSLLLYATTFLLVPLVFIPTGRKFGAELDQSLASGHVSPGLLESFAHPVVRVAHIYEAAAVVVVLVLMLAKPF